MSVSAHKIKGIAEFYLKTSIRNSEAVDIINDGLTKIGSLGLVYGETVIDYEQDVDEWEPLPDNSIGVVFVVDENENLYFRWQFLNEEIKLQDDGGYRVSLRLMPDGIESIEDNIDINPVYENAISYYLRGFFKLRGDDHSPDGARLMRECERMATRAFNTMLRSRQPAQVRKLGNA